jgi:hypothetical protein
MPKRTKPDLLEPFYIRGVPVVLFLGARSRVEVATGDYDESGPLETGDDVVNAARKWQRKRNRLDQTPGVVNSEMKPDSTALDQGVG